LPFLFFGFDLSLLDPDEGLCAALAREILARKDWALPHFNGLPSLEKALLYVWPAAGALWSLDLFNFFRRELLRFCSVRCCSRLITLAR
jgi:4-amino-4-deoxy-L-arabinose transferase-like glycosyltransferase